MLKSKVVKTFEEWQMQCNVHKNFDDEKAQDPDRANFEIKTENENNLAAQEQNAMFENDKTYAFHT